MKKSYCFAIFMLVMGCLAFNACAISGSEDQTAMDYALAGSGGLLIVDQADLPPEDVALSLYVLERKGNGTPLSGVAVTAYDAAGSISRGITASNEPLVIKGQPGTWQFTLAKEGYTAVSLDYNITKTSTAIASVDRIDRSPELVGLTIYVHEGDINGAQLAGVQITGLDAAGDGFEGITDSGGAVTISGEPGTWQLILSKEGFDAIKLDYDVTQTEVVDAYLQRTSQSRGSVALTIYVHDGDLNGTLLADVLVVGLDAAGNGFGAMTDSNGTVVIKGDPGTWQFTFLKEGYETLGLSYNVTETEETAAYLLKADNSQESYAQI